MDWRKILEPEESSPDEYDTWEMDPDFVVKEGADGKLFLMVEVSLSHDLPVLRDGFLALELLGGTTLYEAHKLAGLLRAQVDFLTYTGLVTPEFSDQLGRRGVQRLKDREDR